MNNLAKLISLILRQTQNDHDTTIAVNCHVLASTYYLPNKSHEFLFERIKHEPIW